MKPDVPTKDCAAGAEILGYLYNELGLEDRARFETHLADCAFCIDEFAAAADVRFAVLEWQRADFAELPTPEISIPYETNSDSRAGWMEGLLAIISRPVWAACFAGALLVLAVTTYFLAVPQKNDSTVAAVPKVLTEEAPGSRNLRVGPEVHSEDGSTAALRPRGKGPRSATPVKAAVRPARRSIETREPANAVKIPSTDQALRKPILSPALDDEDDSSLRLADLIDDGGL